MSSTTSTRPFQLRRDENQRELFGAPPRDRSRLWKKYQPSCLAEVFGQASVVNRIDQFLDAPAPAAFVFDGPTGVGKTSVVNAIIGELGIDKDWAYVDIRSGEQDAESVESALRLLNLRAPGGGWKMLEVHEADYMSVKAAQLWLTALEDLPAKSLVVFTTNRPEKFDQRFLDRCIRCSFESDAALLSLDCQALIQRVWTGENRLDPIPTIDQFPTVADSNGKVSFRRLMDALETYMGQTPNVETQPITIKRTHFTDTGYHAGRVFCGCDKAERTAAGDTFVHACYAPDELIQGNAHPHYPDPCPECVRIAQEALADDVEPTEPTAGMVFMTVKASEVIVGDYIDDNDVVKGKIVHSPKLVTFVYQNRDGSHVYIVKDNKQEAFAEREFCQTATGFMDVWRTPTEPTEPTPVKVEQNESSATVPDHIRLVDYHANPDPRYRDNGIRYERHPEGWFNPKAHHLYSFHAMNRDFRIGHVELIEIPTPVTIAPIVEPTPVAIPNLVQPHPSKKTRLSSAGLFIDSIRDKARTMTPADISALLATEFGKLGAQARAGVARFLQGQGIEGIGQTPTDRFVSAMTNHLSTCLDTYFQSPGSPVGETSEPTTSNLSTEPDDAPESTPEASEPIIVIEPPVTLPRIDLANHVVTIATDSALCGRIDTASIPICYQEGFGDGFANAPFAVSGDWACDTAYGPAFVDGQEVRRLVTPEPIIEAKPEPTPVAIVKPAKTHAALLIEIEGKTYGLTVHADGFSIDKADGDSYAIGIEQHGPECSCRDFQFRHKGIHGAKCKHIRALEAVGLLHPVTIAPTTPDDSDDKPVTPTQSEETPVAIGNTHIDRDEAIRRIRAGLKFRSAKAWSVRGGQGTSWGWITITSPPSRCGEYGYVNIRRLKATAFRLGREARQF